MFRAPGAMRSQDSPQWISREKNDRLTIPKGSASLWRLTGSPFTLRTRPSVAVSNTLCSSPEPDGGLKANFSPCGTRWRLPPSGDRRLRPAPYLWPRPVGGVVNLVGVTPERHSVRRRPVLYRILPCSAWLRNLPLLPCLWGPASSWPGAPIHLIIPHTPRRSKAMTRRSLPAQQKAAITDLQNESSKRKAEGADPADTQPISLKPANGI